MSAVKCPFCGEVRERADWICACPQAQNEAALDSILEPGPAEPPHQRHLKTAEQEALHAALRKSVALRRPAEMADSHAGEEVTWDRIANAHSSMCGAEVWKSTNPNEGHRVYKQNEKEACYMCVALKSIKALEAERDTLSTSNGVLAAALEKIATGEGVRPVGTAYYPEGHAQRGQRTKHDKCTHDRRMWEDCDECIAEFARAALSTIEAGSRR